MDKVEHELEELLKKGLGDNEIYWFQTSFQPPNKKQSDTNRSQIEMMFSILFQHKFPALDPRFLITWDRQTNSYVVGILEILNKPELQKCA